MSENRRYRVLHIFSAYGGGVSSLILNLLENKTEDFDFDIMAFSYDKGEMFLGKMNGLGTECFLMPRPKKEGFKTFKKYVQDVFSAKQYDAIHCHIDGWKAYPFYKAAKKAKIKSFIFHAHKTKYESRFDRIPLMRWVNKFSNFHFSTDYMTCSDLAAEYIFGKRYLKKRKAVLIPNGMNVARFEERLPEEKKNAYKEEFGVNENDFVIAHVGRFSFQKNHKFMLSIIKGLKERNAAFCFLFVGSGELFEEIKNLAKEMNITENIRFLGHRNDIPLLMQYADLLILPSLWEGLPTVSVECQAAGTAMLLSNTITPQSDMGLGLLEVLPIDDPNVWVEKIIDRMTSDRVKKDVSDCVNKIVEKGFTAQAAGRLYCSQLESIILSHQREQK